MTYFPQPNRANPARRVKVGGSVPVAIRLEGSQPVRAKLHELSATGGLLVLPKAFEQGDFVELAFQTSKGTIHGMAEVLAARRESSSGCLQPFRFVALDDEDHNRLRMALESLLDQTVIGVPSSKRPSL
jgi:PilZ domain-containing protein